MTLRADGSAFKQFSASRASSLFKAVMSTVCISYDSPFSFIMSERRDLHICGITTSCTGIIRIMASFSTSRGLDIMVNQVMSQCCNRLCNYISAFGTGPVSCACLRASGIPVDNPVSVGVSLCRSVSGLKNFSASRTSSLFKAVMSTIRISYGGPFSFIMSERRYFLICRVSTS